MMRDMTKGAPLGHLFLYAVPLLLGNWLQLAYNAVDSIIAGRFIGQDALAAEGVAGPVMNLVILAISGLCIGAGVLMSEAFGAKRTDRLQETLATTLLFGAVLCCISVCIVCSICRCTALSISTRCGYSVPSSIISSNIIGAFSSRNFRRRLPYFPISGIGGSFSVSAGIW